MIKKTVALLFSLTLALMAMATDYSMLATKAGRFYRYEDWASALAMYQLMLDRRPDVVDTYTHAIVAASIKGDTLERRRLMELSFKTRVPLDSIYNGVMTLSYERGDATLYRSFLESTAREFPWLKRNIESRLLDYYVARRDPDGMIALSSRMLQGMPDNLKFLTILADGYFEKGDSKNAVITYNKVLALNPTDYHALLVMGNYYLDLWLDNRSDAEARALAREYLGRAARLCSTPYIGRRLTLLDATL